MTVFLSGCRVASLVFPELGLGQWQLAQVSERRGGRRGLIPCFGWDDTGHGD